MFADDDHNVTEILKVHAKKLVAAPDAGAARRVHVLHMEADATVKLDADFIRYSADECQEAFNVEYRSVQWMMHQLTTYDPAAEYLAGVRFCGGDVLCHVFPKRKRGKTQRRFA